MNPVVIGIIIAAIFGAVLVNDGITLGRARGPLLVLSIPVEPTDGAEAILSGLVIMWTAAAMMLGRLI